LYPRYHPHPAARHVAKSHEATPFGSKDPSSNTLHFKPIFSIFSQNFLSLKMGLKFAVFGGLEGENIKDEC